MGKIKSNETDLNDLCVAHVSVKFKHLLALNDVSLSLNAGSVHGLVGANGAGKTTLMRVMLGVLQPDAGSVTINGRPPAPADRLRVGAQVDCLGLDKSMSAHASWRYFSRVFGLSSQDANDLAEKTEIDRLLPKRIRSMSTGERRRFEIALSLMTNPSIWILDEPLNGLDPDAIDWLNRLILEKRDQGNSVLVSSHLLSELAKVVDVVTVLREGSVAFQGGVAALSDIEEAYHMPYGGNQ